MMDLSGRLSAFEKLGSFLNSEGLNEMNTLIENAHVYNAWFTEENVISALKAIGENLTKDKLEKWIAIYRNKIEIKGTAKSIGVVMAGNLPLVGFHEFMCVLVSGHKVVAKLSSDDNKLLPAIADNLVEFDPDLKNSIEFTEEKLTGFDAVIATGSNNTSRYFEYYFGKYPNIIRKNRSGVAVLTGNEKGEELLKLGEDVFRYFGMGCRSVSKLFVPKGYDFIPLLDAFNAFGTVKHNNKYKNNYDYYKSIYLINKIKHLDNGSLMIKEDTQYSSPPSVLYYEEYDNLSSLSQELRAAEENIQVVVGDANTFDNAVPFGTAQSPELWDYADGIDTMEFLMNLPD